MSRLTNPERDDRAVIIGTEDEFITVQIFNEAGFITKALLDVTESMSIRQALNWAEQKCQSLQRNR